MAQGPTSVSAGIETKHCGDQMLFLGNSLINQELYNRHSESKAPYTLVAVIVFDCILERRTYIGCARAALEPPGDIMVRFNPKLELKGSSKVSKLLQSG